jgi:hypothetical protein
MLTAKSIIKLLENTGYDVTPSEPQSDGTTDPLSNLLYSGGKSPDVDSSSGNNKIIGAAIQNIVDNLGKDVSLELSELIESALQSVDPNGDLSVADAVSKLPLEDAQKLYFDIKSYLDKNNTDSSSQDNNTGLPQTSSGVVAQDPNTVEQQSQGQSSNE